MHRGIIIVWRRGPAPLKRAEPTRRRPGWRGGGVENAKTLAAAAEEGLRSDDAGGRGKLAREKMTENRSRKGGRFEILENPGECTRNFGRGVADDVVCERRGGTCQTASAYGVRRLCWPVRGRGKSESWRFGPGLWPDGDKRRPRRMLEFKSRTTRNADAVHCRRCRCYCRTRYRRVPRVSRARWRRRRGAVITPMPGFAADR